jgi:putative thioredoxin
MVDVTDATFEQEVLVRSSEVPVVVDLWATWCGPCTTLGPMLERAVADTDGAVVLAKVDVDQNPSVAASFRVQSIPAVFAVRDGAVVDQFIGALPEPAVREFVERLLPVVTDADRAVDEAVALDDRGDTAGAEAEYRRALDLQPDHLGAVTGLAALLVADGRPAEAVTLLGRVPETGEVRRLLAEARLAAEGVAVGATDVTAVLDDLLERVREDDGARQEFVDLLETLGPDDERTASYRRALASRLF